MTEIPKSRILDAAEDADIDEEHIRWDYSGRGMYGGNRFGIVGHLETYAQFLLMLARTDDEGAEIAWELSERAQTDSMGFRTIFYFPNATVTG